MFKRTFNLSVRPAVLAAVTETLKSPDNSGGGGTENKRYTGNLNLCACVDRRAWLSQNVFMI